MKKFKCMIIFIITAAVLISMAIPTYAKTEEGDPNYPKNVKKLYDLGLITDINSFEDPEKNITRIELLKNVIKYMGYEELVAENHEVIFSDVDAYSDYNNYIAVGVDRGILTGFSDGCFYPDMDAELNQAIKIITALFGYNTVAELKGGYPGGYIYAASQIGLLKGVESFEKLDCKTFVKLLVNGLDAEIMEYSDNNIEKSGKFLEERYDIYKFKGIMTATSENAALGESELHGSNVRIGGHEFYCADEKVNSYFGYEIELYYKDGYSGDEIKYYEATDKNATITVLSDDIESKNSAFSEQNFVYLSDNKTRNADIKGATVVYNGKTDAFYSRNNLSPKNGEVTLLDNNGDGKYEYVFVFDAQYSILLRGVQKDKNKNIYYDYLDSTISFTVDAEDKSSFRVTKDGAKIPITDLAAKDVLLVGQSKNGDYTIIKASTKTVSGTITGTNSENEALINDDTYKISEIYEKYTYQKTSKYVNELKAGMQGVYYIDSYGRIAAASKDEDDALKYGYLFNAMHSDDDNGIAWIKMLTQDNENDIFFLNEKVSINGKREDAKDAVAELLRGSTDTDYGKGSGCRQVIMFKKDDAGKIKEIHTTANPEVLKYEGMHTKVDIFDYYLLSWNKERFANDKTVWFNIYPDDEGMSEAISWDAKYPRITVYFYNKDAELNVGAVVRYQEGMAEVGNSVIATSQRFVIADSFINMVDEDDTVRKALKGYGVDGKEKIIYPSDKTNSYVQERLYELKCGDVFIYDTDAKGRLSSVVRIYDSSKPDLYGSWGDNSQQNATHKSPQGLTDKWFWYDKSRWEIYGKVYDLIDDCVLYYIKEDASGKPILTRDYLKDVPMAVIDTANGKAEFTFNYDYSQITAGDNILVAGQSSKINEVIIIRN